MKGTRQHHIQIILRNDCDFHLSERERDKDAAHRPARLELAAAQIFEILSVLSNILLIWHPSQKDGHDLQLNSEAAAPTTARGAGGRGRSAAQ